MDVTQLENRFSPGYLSESDFANRDVSCPRLYTRCEKGNEAAEASGPAVHGFLLFH